MADNAGCLPCGPKVMNRAARNAAIDAAQEEFGTQYIVSMKRARPPFLVARGSRGGLL